MKTKRAALLMVILLTISTHLFAQLVGRQHVDQFTRDQFGNKTYGLTWLPSDYSSTTTNYPVIIFLHGTGESGTGVTGLNKLIGTGLPQLIAQGWDPQAVNPVDGKTYKFIVVSPQAPSWSYGYPQIQYIINDVIKQYRVDISRIYLTGLSAGGAGTWAGVTNGADFAKTFPAIVAVSAAGTNSPAEATQIPFVGGTYGVKVWSICGTTDSFWNLAVSFTNQINSASPAPSVPAILTPFTGLGHGSAVWNTAYDANWRSNSQNMNIFEWMLQYQKSVTVPVPTSNIPPVALAGNDTTITLPANTIVLNGTGTDADGSITLYQWNKISGPASYNIIAATQAQSTVNNLAAGTYQFELVVTDNQGATGKDTMNVIVNPAPAPPPNRAPVANAGNDTTITLPAGTASLNGSGSDSDGTIATYSWTKISGPASYNIVASTQAQTNVNNLDSGTYQFEIIVTDNQGAVGRDTVIVTVNPPPPPAANIAPIAIAGNDTTLILPLNSITLSGRGKDIDGSISSYKWAVISGPSTYSISNPDSAAATFSNLVAGNYNLRLTVTDNQGDTGIAYLNIKVLPAPQPGYFFPTANDASSYVLYSGKYSYGVNPGYYTTNWTAQNTATIAMGSQAAGVKGAGVKSLRVPLYDDFLTTWGETILLKDFQYYASIGANEITAFVGSPASIHRFDTTFAGSPEPSKVFKNLYEPVWLDSAHTQVNPNNYYAKYLYDVVKTYGQYVKFWEIVNEPDFTYSDAGWTGDGNPIGQNSWFYHNPNASELVNLRAPLSYYIRELRVAWEVIKKLSPDSYICTGGIGYKSFLDAILRNTDNPVDGSVTNDFPLKGGAYFDVLSFHSYPEFYLKSWNTATGSIDYFRHSDSALNAYITIKNNMDHLMETYGYDGNQFPKKQFICTETGVSRVMSGTDWGSNEGQKNYMIKAQVASQRASIKQVYWYQLGDMNTANQFDQMGLYYYFGNNTPYNQTLSDQGKALKTTSDLLYGKVYDSARSAALKLPAQADGLAFKAQDGSYIYVLWARTTKDLSETTSASYSFPSAIASKLIRKEWDFSQTNASSVILATGVTLNGTPSFFEVAPPGTNVAPVAHAGKDTSITLPANSVIIHGSGTDADGSITTYQWSKISGPATYTIVSANQAQTAVNNLAQGVYQFELTVTDNQGAKGKDTMVVTVNQATPPPPANLAPKAFAGKDTAITLPSNTAILNGKGTDADGTIASYTWSKLSGPSSFNIVSSAQAITNVNNLVQGTYQFVLTVTDNKGAIGKDTMAILVNAPVVIPPTPPSNPGPVAHAGKDTTVMLPASSIILNGSGTDAGGTITAYKWQVISGPASYSVDGATQPQPTIRYLVQGYYQFELTVTDNRGLTAKDTVVVTVLAAPRLVSNASIYPNPATSTIYINIEAISHASLSSIEIYDIRGVLVYSEEFMRTQQKITKQLDISRFVAGAYIVRINTDLDHAIILKFIKR